MIDRLEKIHAELKRIRRRLSQLTERRSILRAEMAAIYDSIRDRTVSDKAVQAKRKSDALNERIRQMSVSGKSNTEIAMRLRNFGRTGIKELREWADQNRTA